MPSTLTTLQDSIARRLMRRRELRDVPILTRRNGELSQRLSEAIKTGRGVCIIVMPPEPTQADPNATTLVITELVVRVRVVENAFSAHPQHDALSVAELVSRVLQGWSPNVPGITTPLALEADDAWDMPDEPDKHGRYKIDINFATAASL